MKVMNGSQIDVFYTGRYPDGEIFDQSTPELPLSFTAGQGQVIAGFDSAVLGLKVGDKTTVTLAPVDAYGEYDDELVILMSKDQFPKEAILETGMRFMLRSPEGVGQMATIVAIEEHDVQLDLNHAMAGKTLVFDIEIAAIKG